MSRQHSIVPHRANYFYRILEDDYLLVYETLAEGLDPIKDQEGKKLSGPSDCKAMIASVLENWMNSKRLTAKCEEDLYVYLTYDEWESELRHRYGRSKIMQCLDEMEKEGCYVDTEGTYGERGTVYTGTIKKRHFVQNTFEYQLNLPVVISLLEDLPEQSPFEQKARPSLGRPKKYRPEKNDIKVNDIDKNGLNVADGSVKVNDQSIEVNAAFYTHITHTKHIHEESTGEQSDTPTSVSSLSFDAAPSPLHSDSENDSHLPLEGEPHDPTTHRSGQRIPEHSAGPATDFPSTGVPGKTAAHPVSDACPSQPPSEQPLQREQAGGGSNDGERLDLAQEQPVAPAQDHATAAFYPPHSHSPVTTTGSHSSVIVGTSLSVSSHGEGATVAPEEEVSHAQDRDALPGVTVTDRPGAISSAPLPQALSGPPPPKQSRKKPQEGMQSEPAEIRARIIKHRGYALEEKVEIIRENQAIRTWCGLHTLAQYDLVMDELKRDPYWGKSEHYYRIGGLTLLRETSRVLAKIERRQASALRVVPPGGEPPIIDKSQLFSSQHIILPRKGVAR